MLKSNKIPYPVILASASPRRQELLKNLINEFETLPSDINEDLITDPDPWLAGQKIAKEKVFIIHEKRPDALIIAGDTIVAAQEGNEYKMYPKPKDQVDAFNILSKLSGREHLVITAIALRWPKGFRAFTETTHVTFRKLDPKEIEEYIATGEPMDKAGAYAIQGGAKKFVTEIRGSLDNVIGLPTEALQQALREIK